MVEFKLKDVVRIKKNKERYVYTKKGSEGTIIKLYNNNTAAKVKWYKLTGEQITLLPQIFTVDLSDLDFVSAKKDEVIYG